MIKQCLQIKPGKQWVGWSLIYYFSLRLKIDLWKIKIMKSFYKLCYYKAYTHICKNSQLKPTFKPNKWYRHSIMGVSRMHHS